jgi:hypothetical protein
LNPTHVKNVYFILTIVFIELFQTFRYWHSLVMASEIDSKSEQRRIARLKMIFHSLATRVLTISLHHIDSVYPPLRELPVS